MVKRRKDKKQKTLHGKLTIEQLKPEVHSLATHGYKQWLIPC
jgi:hypothetical protein